MGASTYFKSGWNRFDFFLITASLPSLLVGLVDLPDTSILLLLRLLRLVRLIRFFKFVPHVDKVLAGLGRALKASFLVLGVLGFFNFLLAIITCHFYAEIAPDDFGDPLTSMFSIFQMFTIEGWNEIPADIAASITENGSPSALLSSGTIITFTRIYFAMVVLLGGIFGLSLANAVFVDEMTIDNNDELEVKIDEIQKNLEQLQAQLAEAIGIMKTRS
jgi:voltage-gated sodium channel